MVAYMVFYGIGLTLTLTFSEINYTRRHLSLDRASIAIDQLDRIDLPGLAMILTRLPCSLMHYRHCRDYLLIKPRNRKRPRVGSIRILIY